MEGSAAAAGPFLVLVLFAREKRGIFGGFGWLACRFKLPVERENNFMGVQINLWAVGRDLWALK